METKSIEIAFKTLSLIRNVFSMLSLEQRRAVKKYLFSIFERRGYAPGWERIRLIMLPYVELVDGFGRFLFGLVFCLFFGAVICAGVGKISGWWLGLAIALMYLSAEIMLRGLQAVSWAHHEIMLRYAAKR
jgi:hypothetical protein